MSTVQMYRCDRCETTKPAIAMPIHHGGTRVNGVYAEPSPFVIDKGGKPY